MRACRHSTPAQVFSLLGTNVTYLLVIDVSLPVDETSLRLQLKGIVSSDPGATVVPVATKVCACTHTAHTIAAEYGCSIAKEQIATLERSPSNARFILAPRTF